MPRCLTWSPGDEIRPYVTAAVVQEYDRVLGYDRLQHLDKRRVANLSRLLKAAAAKVKPWGRPRLSGHADDNRIYECAAAAKAHYLVTENTKHFQKSLPYTKIITARQLLKVLEEEKTQT
jgi:predicted nucleic acid-binding protein